MALSTTDIDLAKRANPLKDMDAPRAKQSSTDRENTEPSLDKPSSDTEDPRRLKLLRDIVDPK
jgi:hypothetical protein